MKLKIGDILIVVICLILTAGIVVSHVSGQYLTDDMAVEVVIEREVVDSLPLNVDMTKIYESELGMNTLVIKDQQVHIHEADCKDLICVNTKSAVYAGDAIVCLPNRFSIELIGEKEGGVDAISQ